MSIFSSYYPNRTMCDVLGEMRICHKTRNYAGLLGMIEEVQAMGNRMEAALGDKADVAEMQEKRRELRREIKELRKEKAKLDKKTKKKRG